jgi:hypothetical protein
MGARRRSRGRLGLAVAWSLVIATAAWAEAPEPGRLLPLAVRDGRCEFVLPTTRPDEKYYLLLGSLARGAGPYAVTVRTEAADGPASLAVADPPPDPAWVRRTADFRDRLAKAARGRLAAVDYRPPGEPPRQRAFSLFTRANEFQDPAAYATIVGELRAVGRHCQVYVDRDHPDPAALQPTVDDVVRTFDEEVFPRACRDFGRALDVDRDGRFTILFTGWLGRLVNGRVAIGGFVRGSDFYRDLAGPYGNRCDMMYLNTDLRPGPLARSLLAHEYTHAVVFSEHVFGGYLPELPRQDEEGWLNEALAHLAEDLHGYSWANLDYRVSAFLSDPGRYQLVVPDYYAAGLFRSHGNRGATYLFLRWCADRYGADFAGRLIQTSLTGTANVEVAAGEPFARLFRQWSAALVLGGTGLVGEELAPVRRIDPRRPLGGRLLCGPRDEQMPLAGGPREVRLAGTAAAALLLHSPAAGYTRVSVTAAPGADLQVSLVRLPPLTGRLSLRAVATGDDGRGVRLVLTAHDADLTLEGAAWERLVPTANRPEDTSYSPQTAADVDARAWFGDVRLKAGETRASAVIPLPAWWGPNEAAAIKVAATDPAGHRLAAWALLRGVGE